MREILFRGKRVDNGEWVQGYYVETLRYNNLYWIWDGKEYVKVIPETVGQFTGLTDKNGKQIFEGDIVRVPIFYDVGCYPHTESEIRIVKIPDIYVANRDGDFEVIGNIHDTPRTLGGTQRHSMLKIQAFLLSCRVWRSKKF